MMHESTEGMRSMQGALMAAEMSHQPEVLRRLIDSRSEIIKRARAALPDDLRGIVLVARGSSDNAAIYGRYLLELAAALPVALAAPSLHTLYGVRRAHYRGYVAVGVSQSGHTPEIATVLGLMRDAGAVTIGITNDPGSPLADSSDVILALEAGEERAIPATKTFTAQLALFALLAEALGDVPWTGVDWEALPDHVSAALADEAAAVEVTQRIGAADHILTVGRGFFYPVALEAALKLKEAALVHAEGYSSADLRHGPIAIVKEAMPVVTFMWSGATATDTADLIPALRARGASLFEVSDRRGAALPLDSSVSEFLAPIPMAVRAQQVARLLALSRGLDPDAPAGLSKLTATF